MVEKENNEQTKVTNYKLKQFAMQHQQSQEELLKHAYFVAGKCIELLIERQNSAKIAVHKKDQDFATNADLDSENLAIELITKKYPDHSIVSEEKGFIDKKSTYVWYIDPLDGTKEYIRGESDFNVLVSIEKNEEIIVGVIWANGFGDIYKTTKHGGASVNNKRIKVSSVTNVREAIVGYHLPSGTKGAQFVETQLDILKHIILTTHRVRPGRNDATGLGNVAKGSIDAYILPTGINYGWHDVAAGILAVEESGGKVTNWLGEKIHNHNLSHGILASNSHIHDDILGLIKT